MFKHIPTGTRIFIGLFVLTLLLTYFAMSLSDYAIRVIAYNASKNMAAQRHNKKPAKVVSASPTPSVATQLDTKSWPKYTDPKYPLSFLHPKAWTLKSVTNAAKFYDITITIPKETGVIHIYISKTNYFGLDQLDQQPYELNGAKGVMVSSNLFGLKKGDYYYTFDASMNNNHAVEFAALVQSVKF